MAVTSKVFPAFATAEETADYYARAAGYHADQATGGLRVIGELCGAVGLKEGDHIDRDQLIRLMKGEHPTENELDGTPASLIKLRKQRRSLGADLTFSAPKSVSVESESGAKDAAQIRDAHEEAAAETFKLYERAAGYRRRLDGGEPEHIHSGKLIASRSTDSVNRNDDPHLHTHFAVMNLTQTEPGQSVAVDFNATIKSNYNLMFDAFYMATMRQKLHAIGRATVTKAGGGWELDTISDKTIDGFSSRRNEIRAARKRGLSNQDAFLQTRSKKNNHADDHAGHVADLRGTWRDRRTAIERKHKGEHWNRTRQAEYKQWRDDTARSSFARMEFADAPRREIVEIIRAAERATSAETYTNIYGLTAQFITEHAETSGKVLTIDAAQEKIRRAIDAGIIREFTHKTGKGTEQKFYTTWDMFSVERDIIERAARKDGLTLSEADARADVERLGKNLSRDQKAAIIKLLSGGGAVRIMQGDPGSGKTSSLDIFRQAIEQAGGTVRGCAVASFAAAGLRSGSGIHSDNLETELRKNYDEQPAPDFLICDEANTVSPSDFKRLIDHCDRHGITLIPVGDTGQIRAIGGGKIFERLVERARDAGELAELTENFRQEKMSGLVEIVDRLKRGSRDGRRDALKILDMQARINDGRDVDGQLDRMAASYDAGGGVLLIAGTREYRDEIADRVRGRLVNEKIIRQDTETEIEIQQRDQFGNFHTETLTVAVGDRLRLTKNRRKLNLKNGTRAEVQTIGADTITLKIFGAHGSHMQEIDRRKYNFFDYDYCQTIWSAEGATADKCAVWFGTDADTAAHFTNARNLFVSATRARKDFQIFTDNKKKLFDLAAIDPPTFDTLDDTEITREMADAKLERLRNLLDKPRLTLADLEPETDRPTIAQDERSEAEPIPNTPEISEFGTVDDFKDMTEKNKADTRERGRIRTR